VDEKSKIPSFFKKINKDGVGYGGHKLATNLQTNLIK
jgi:hypothetical protein